MPRKKIEGTVLTETFGNSPFIRILDFFLDNKLFDFSQKEIIKATGISKMTVSKYLKILKKLGVIKVNRKFNRAVLYKLDFSNPLVKKIMEIEDYLIQKGYEEALKIPVKVRRWGH